MNFETVLANDYLTLVMEFKKTSSSANDLGASLESALSNEITRHTDSDFGFVEK